MGVDYCLNPKRKVWGKMFRLMTMEGVDDGNALLS